MKYIIIDPMAKELLYVISEDENIIEECTAKDFFEIEYVRIKNKIERKNVLVDMGYRKSVFLACAVLEWTPVKGKPHESRFEDFPVSRLLPPKFFATDIRSTFEEQKADKFIDCKKIIKNYIEYRNKQYVDR